jgi:hypothetical protein
MQDTLDQADLTDFLSAHIQVLIAEANEAGFGTDEILAALSHIISAQRLAYDADPDPADDPGLEAARSAGVDVPDDARDNIDTEKDVPRAG